MATDKYFAEIADKMKEAMRLADTEYKFDPEDFPYRSKYKSREILNEIKTILDNRESDSEESNDRITCLLAAVHMYLGINYVDCEEISSGQEHFEKALAVLEPWKYNEKAFSVYLKTANQLGILWANRQQVSSALKYFEIVEEMYNTFDRLENVPLTVDEITLIKEEETKENRILEIEDTFTHTLYYYAQLYCRDDTDKAANYCKLTLQRQLKYSNNFDHIDWAVNAATLSQYYLPNNNYKIARNCLAAASYILSQAPSPEIPLDVDPNSQVALDAKEKIQKCSADIRRCGVKYGLLLLENSWKIVMNQMEETAETDEEDIFKFDLELDEQIACRHAKSFDEAKKLFLQVQNYLNEAKDFYKLDSHCSDHIEIIQDYSKLFKFLSYFEPDLERQCKMHKRRIDMLTGVLNELNPQHYLLVCRQLQYEIAEIYSAMLDLKLALIESGQKTPDPKSVNKVNQLSNQGIIYYDKFIQSFNNPEGKTPDKIPTEDERPFLIAWFCKGRLFSKIIESNPNIRAKNVQKTIDCYKVLVDYCYNHKETEDKVKDELGICIEMINILPAKIQNILAAHHSW
ncbi:unnamed protein product [Dimorphilus gyrociliatus]|uniref:KIF-binding protein n=1 Tax=Dimorphilus gyrociliatus TaxID=2664684 RepID=A0A7I8VBP3_9ANNE|nr:unnamed protein product [Dimorphilus gyrociliatus]